MGKNLPHLSCKQSAVISTGKSAGNLFSQVNTQENPLETFSADKSAGTSLIFVVIIFLLNTKKLLKKH
jgi:hypothetical protein